MMIVLPRYSIYYSLPVMFQATPSGGMRALKLNRDTGAFEPGNELIDPITWATSQEIHTVSEDEFFQAVEEARGKFVKGDGPVFALYGVINAIHNTAYQERRGYTPEERAFIWSLRLETRVLFEEELQRRAADAAQNPDPTTS